MTIDETTKVHWDKRLCAELVKNGLTHDQAMVVVGIVAEQRQQADREGYQRGYDDGYTDGTQPL